MVAGVRYLRLLSSALVMVTVVFLASAAVALAAPASSQPPIESIGFTKTVPDSGGAYSWTLSGLPDLDQVRSPDSMHLGLPNQGFMYCVPTAGMNILAFLAKGGFSTGVASKDWTLPVNYDEMTGDLKKLGTEMGTDPAGGTDGGFVPAMTARLAGATKVATSPFVLSFVSYQLDPTWQGASARQMALAGLNGSLVAVGIGYYSNENDPNVKALPTPGKIATSGPIVKRRVGGHFLTAVGASGKLFQAGATIQVRDPATPYVMHSYQSAYATDPHQVVPATYNFVYKDTADNKDKFYTANLGTWDASNTTLYEGYFKVDPTVVWVRNGKSLREIQPFKIAPNAGTEKTVFDLPGKGSPIQAALSAVSANPAVLVKGSNTIWSLDPVTGKSTSVGKLVGARALAFGGPRQTLFVAGSKKLVAVDQFTHQVVASHKLSTPLQTLAFDEKNDRLVGAGAGKLDFFDLKLHSKGSEKLKGLTGGGRLQLAIAPNGGVVVAMGGGTLVTSTSGFAHKGTVNSKVKLVTRKLAGKGTVHGLVVDDRGNILVARKGHVRLLDSTGHEIPRGNPFGGRADEVFAIRRSFSNANPHILQPSLDFLPGPAPQPPSAARG